MADTYKKMAGWGLTLKVNGATVDTCDRQHAAEDADESTLTGFAELKLEAGDVVTLEASSDKKNYTISGGDATLQCHMLRWW